MEQAIHSLQPLSHKHYHTLLLCWKIRMSLRKQVSSHRIKRYADWFFDYHLQPHFKMEEDHVFPILGADHPLIKKATAEHRRLKRLFTTNTDVKRNLSLIEEELESHVRFEERVLFQKIQEKVITHNLTVNTVLHHEEAFIENMEDPFWE